jgi:hypothetical protein
MLTIREEQMRALTEELWKNVADELRSHVLEFFPRESAWMGDTGVRALIDRALKDAPAHGLESPREMANYVNLMLQLGADFPNDPTLPWAARDLIDPDVSDAFSLTEMLCDSAAIFEDRTVGANGSLLHRAIERIQTFNFEATPDPLEAGELGRVLCELCPERCADLELHCIEALLTNARAVASRYQMSREPSIMRLAVIMVLIGSGFDRDPKTPWAHHAPNQARSSQQLLCTTLDYLRDINREKEPG